MPDSGEAKLKELVPFYSESRRNGTLRVKGSYVNPNDRIVELGNGNEDPKQKHFHLEDLPDLGREVEIKEERFQVKYKSYIHTPH